MGKPPPANENEENSSPQNSDIQSLIDNMIKTPLSPENEIKFKILLNTCSYTDLNEALSSILASLIQSFHEKANLKQGSDYKFFILKPLSEIRYSIDESLMTDDNMKTINSIVPKLSFDSLYYLSLILKNTIISPNLKQSKPLQKFMDVYYDSIDRLCKFYIDEFKDKNYKKLHMLIPIFDSFINTASYDIPLKFTAKGNFSKIIQSILSIDLDPDVFRTYKTFLSLKIKSYRLLSYDPTIIDTNLNDLLIDASKLALKIVSPLLDKLNELQTVLILIITKISEKKEESTEIMQSALSQIYSLFNHSPQYRIFAIKILDQICQQFPDIFKDSSTYVHCINKFIQDPVINPMKRFNILENLIDAIQFTNDNDYVAHMSFIQVSIGSLMKKYFNNLKNFVDQKTIENHKEIYELSEDMYHAMIIYEKIVVPEKQVSIILDESFKSAREIMDVYEYNLRFITLYQTYINFFSNFTKDSVIPNNFDDQAKLVLILSELQKQCDNLVKILPILYKNMPKPIIEDIFTNYFNNCFDEGLFTLIKFGYMENRDLFGEIFRVLIVESSERILKNNNVRKQLIFIRNWVNYVIEWQQTINTKIVANDVDYIMYACVITISNHIYFEDSLKTLLSIFSFLTIFQIKNSFLPVPTNVRDILTASVNYDIFIPELTDFLNHAFKAEPKYLCDQMICSFLIQALPKMPEQILSILAKIRKTDRKTLIEAENKSYLLLCLKNILNKLDNEQKRISLKIISDIYNYCDTPYRIPQSSEIVDHKVIDIVGDFAIVVTEFNSIVNGLLQNILKTPTNKLFDLLEMVLTPYLKEVIWSDDKHRFVSKIFCQIIENCEENSFYFFKKLIDNTKNSFILSHIYFAVSNFGPLNEKLAKLVLDQIETKEDFVNLITNATLFFEMKISMGESTRILLLKSITKFANRKIIDVPSFCDFICRLINSDIIPDNNCRYSKLLSVYELRLMPKWLQKATYFCKEVFNEQNEKEDGIKLFEKLLMRRNPYEAMIYIEVLEKYKEKEVIDKYISLYFDSFMEIPNIEMAQILSILFRFNTNLISKFADRMNKYMTDKFVNEWPEIIIEFGIPLIDQSLTEYKIQTDFVLGSIDPKFGIIVPRHAVLLAQALMKTSPEQNEEIISFIDEQISSVSEMNDMFTNSATITELFDSFLELAPQKFTKLLEQCLERSTTIDDDFPSKDDAIEAHSFIGTLIHLASHSTILKQVKEQKLFDKFVSKMSKIFEILPSLVTDLTIEDFWNFAKYFDDSLFNYFKNNNDMSFLTVLPEFLLTKKSDFFTKQLKNDLSLLKRKLNSKKQEAAFINLLLSLFEKESNEQITEIITKYKSTIHDTKTDAFLLSRITEYLKTTKNNNQNEQIKYEFIPGNKTSHNMTILNFYKNSISDNNIFKTFIKNIDIYDNGKLKDLNIDCDYLIKIINKNMSDGIFLFKMFNFIGSNMESFSNHIDKLYHYLQIVLFTFMNINHENFKNLSVFIKPICNILKTKSTENMNSLFLDILSKMQDLHSDDNNDIIKFYPMLGECISELPKINSQEIFEKTHQVLQKLLSGKKDEKAILAVLTSILSMTKHMDIQSNYVDLYASTLSSENFEISLQTFRILQKFIHIEMVRNILSDKFATMREIGKCLSVILLWKQNMPVDFSISYLLKSSLEFSFHSVAQNFLTSYVFYNVFSSNIENSLSVLLTYVNDAISSKSANKLKAVYNALIKLMKDKNKIAEKILGSLTQNKDFVSVVCDKNINEFSKLETNVLELLPQIPNCSICFENKFPENSKTNIVVAAQTLSKLFDISQFDSLRILSYFTKMEIKLLAKIKIEEKNEFLQVKLRQSFDSELGDWDKTKVNLSDNPDFIDSTYEIIPKPLIYSHHLYFDKAFKSLTDYNDEMTAAVSSMALQRGERSILRTFCDGLPRDRVPSQELFGIIKKLKNEVIPLTKSDEICQFVVISQVKQFIRSISKSKGIPDFVIKISPAEMTEVQNSFESISQKINNLTGKILPVKPNLIEKSNKCFMMNQDEENDIAEKNESQLLTFMLSCPIKDETELKFCYPLIRQILERNMKSFVAYSALYYLYKNNLISGKKLMTSLVPIARIPAEFSHLFAQFVNKENPSLESRIHPAFSFVIHPGKNKFVQLVLRKSNEERYKILIDKSQKDEFKETSYYERFCLQNIYPLLETHLQTDIIEISFKYSSLDANYLSVSALLYTGERINYLVTNQPFTTPENTTAAREITRIFGRSPSSLMRNQRLMYFDSEKLSDDCYLTRTDNLPFVKNESAVEFNSIQCFDNKKEYVEWMTQFAYNYAALSSILYVRNAETFNGHKALLDKRSANVSQLFMERSEKQNVMKVFDVKNVLMGPFRNAFISACDALSLKSVRMRMIGVCLLSDTKEDATKTEEKSHYLSLRNNDSDVLQERINNLITSTDTKTFSWFI